MDASFRLLGSAEIAVGPQTVPLPSNKPCIVLATLLLCANEFVSAERLREAVWGDAPPSTARATLQTYVLRLRHLLAKHEITRCPILTVPRGYTIQVGKDDLDVLRFRYAAQVARRHADAGELDAESRCLSAALDLWRGPALSNVDSELLHREEVPKLAEERLEMMERYLDVELLLGRYRGLVPELRALTAAHPHRERFAEQLIEALYRSGRQSEALAEYRRIRTDLVDSLGIDPGPRLRELELTILRGDSMAADEPDHRELVIGRPATPDEVPADSQGAARLPLDVPDFVGREDFGTAILDDLVDAAGRQEQAIATISGSPGVGKTALAVHVAQQARTAFPDGQWLVRLRRADGVPRQPDAVLLELLQNLGVDTTGLPERTAALAATYRSALNGRRVLLVLDDVVDSQQAEQLLPGTSGSAVLLTSRMSLIGLTTLWGIRSHRLPVLDDESARRLLIRLLGEQRTAAEPEAVAKLAELCGGLPLALRIAATKLQQRDDPDLAAFVGWLSVNPLAKLSVGRDPAISVRREFESSYRRLEQQAQQLFAFIGSRPAAGVGADQVAIRFGIADFEAEELFDQLLDANLIECSTAGRYSATGLLRRYATQLAQTPVNGRHHQQLSDLTRLDPSAVNGR